MLQHAKIPQTCSYHVCLLIHLRKKNYSISVFCYLVIMGKKIFLSYFVAVFTD